MSSVMAVQVDPDGQSEEVAPTGLDAEVSWQLSFLQPVNKAPRKSAEAPRMILNLVMIGKKQEIHLADPNGNWLRNVVVICGRGCGAKKSNLIFFDTFVISELKNIKDSY